MDTRAGGEESARQHDTNSEAEMQIRGSAEYRARAGMNPLCTVKAAGTNHSVLITRFPSATIYGATAPHRATHHCPSGGTGRRAWFRVMCPLRAWRFDSSLGHPEEEPLSGDKSRFEGLLLFWVIVHPVAPKRALPHRSSKGFG